jgi:RNA polymerase sigma factor (sigma-70 family)
VPQERRYVLTRLGQSLAAENIRLAFKMARRYGFGLDPDDADSLAMSAMIAAIAHYGPRIPVKLSTKISEHIRGRLHDARKKNGRRRPTGSLTVYTGDREYQDEPPDHREPEPWQYEEQPERRRQAVLDATEKLRERWRLVVKARMDGRTLDEIGAQLGVTRERVRQIEEAAVVSLRRTLNPSGAPPCP